MARPLRIERPGGRYHITTRGNERKSIYRDDHDREHFVGLLAEVAERHRLKVHCFVLMDNHFHLLVETPEANLSKAMQWLNVSFSVWFNRRHQRAGHLFQGRFKAIIVEDDAGWQELARYVHLNPVRVAGLGLDKGHRIAAREGAGPAPTPQIVAERLRTLRQWRWSSYPAFAGYRAAPSWLEREPVARLCGGRTEQEQQTAFRRYTEEAVQQGVLEPPWSRLVAGVVLGTEAFAQRLRQELIGDRREQTEVRKLERGADGENWIQIVQAVERSKGESWEEFHLRHGDWGRDAALWLGRRRGLSLRQLGQSAGGIDYSAVSRAVARFEKRMEREPKLMSTMEEIRKQMSNV